MPSIRKDIKQVTKAVKSVLKRGGRVRRASRASSRASSRGSSRSSTGVRRNARRPVRSIPRVVEAVTVVEPVRRPRRRNRNRYSKKMVSSHDSELCHHSILSCEQALSGVLEKVTGISTPDAFMGSKQVGARVTAQQSVTVPAGMFSIIMVNPYLPGGLAYSTPSFIGSAIGTFPSYSGVTQSSTAYAFLTSGVAFPAPTTAQANLYDYNPQSFFTQSSSGIVNATWNLVPVTQTGWDTNISPGLSLSPAIKMTGVLDSNCTPSATLPAIQSPAPDLYRFQSVQFTGGTFQLETAVPYTGEAQINVMDFSSNPRVHSTDTRPIYNGVASDDRVTLREQKWMTTKAAGGPTSNLTIPKLLAENAGTDDLSSVIFSASRPTFCQGGTPTARWFFESQIPAVSGSSAFLSGSSLTAPNPSTTQANIALLQTYSPAYTNIWWSPQNNDWVVCGTSGTNSVGSTSLLAQNAQPPFCHLARNTKSVTQNQSVGTVVYNTGITGFDADLDTIPEEPYSLFSVTGTFETATTFYYVAAQTSSVILNLTYTGDFAMVVDPSLAVANRSDPVIQYTPTTLPKHCVFTGSGPTAAAARTEMLLKSANHLQANDPSSAYLVESMIPMATSTVDSFNGGNMRVHGAVILDQIYDATQEISTKTVPKTFSDKMKITNEFSQRNFTVREALSSMQGLRKGQEEEGKFDF